VSGMDGGATNRSIRSTMSESRLAKLQRLQHREQNADRVPRSQLSSRSGRPLTGASHMMRPRTGASMMMPPMTAGSRPRTGASCASRPRTGMPNGGFDSIPEGEEEYGDGGSQIWTAEDEDGEEDGEAGEVDEWALLNELDMTCYQFEQQKRRRDDYLNKKKVRDDLFNQMREKSESQANQRDQEYEEHMQQEDRLQDWNESEEMRDMRNTRKKERTRKLLLRQAEVAAAHRRKTKNDELEQGRETAAQIREDICNERERAVQERTLAHEEFAETCRQNEMLRMQKEEMEEEAAQQAADDADLYFRKQALAEEERQRQIADRYNSCRVREKVVTDKLNEIGATSTFVKKSEAELDDEMAEAQKIFDQKEGEKRQWREAEKRKNLKTLQDQMSQKDEQRASQLNNLLQTVGDMRDAMHEHEKDSKMERMYKIQQQKQYGDMLKNQWRADKNKKERRGMTPNERRINLPLLEKLRDTCITGGPGQGQSTVRTVTPFSERGSRSGTPQMGGDHKRAAKIRQKMKKDTIQFG